MVVIEIVKKMRMKETERKRTRVKDRERERNEFILCTDKDESI